MVRWSLVVAVVAACGSERPRDATRAPAPPPQPVARAAEPPPAPPAAASPGTWRDFDALPPGAVKRLGSQHMVSWSSVVAIKNDGTVALVDDDLGLIEVRADGKYRVLATDDCTRAYGLVAYVGDELRARCKSLHDVRGGVDTTSASPCNGEKAALSRSGDYLTCTSFHDQKTELLLVKWPATTAWTLPVTDEPAQLYVTDSGDVVVIEAERVRLVRDGHEVWARPLDLEWTGLDRTQLVGWTKQDQRLVRIALADGSVVSRIALAKDTGVARNISAIGDGSSYYLALYGRFPGSGPDAPGETFRARVDARTGRILAAWHAAGYEWANAVSPDGTYAASVGVGEVLRIHLDHPAAPPERPAHVDKPAEVAVSADGKTVAFVTSESEDPILRVFDATSGTERVRVAGPEFAQALSVSPDGTHIAAAGQFGQFTMYDARTGATQCSSTEIPGATIAWHGSRLVASYPGDNGDDCDEITEGSITVADDHCKVIKQYSVYGMVGLLEDKPDRTIVAMADWKNRCGENYELKPWKAYAIDHKTGAKVAVPARDAEWPKREKAQEQARDSADSPLAEALAEGTVVVSADGHTRATLELENDRRYLHCSDPATGKTFVRHELPSGVGEPFAVASDGKWAVVSDHASLLVYPCRP